MSRNLNLIAYGSLTAVCLLGFAGCAQESASDVDASFAPTVTQSVSASPPETVTEGLPASQGGQSEQEAVTAFLQADAAGAGQACNYFDESTLISVLAEVTGSSPLDVKITQCSEKLADIFASWSYNSLLGDLSGAQYATTQDRDWTVVSVTLGSESRTFFVKNNEGLGWQVTWAGSPEAYRNKVVERSLNDAISVSESISMRSGFDFSGVNEQSLLANGFQPTEGVEIKVVAADPATLKLEGRDSSRPDLLWTYLNTDGVVQGPTQ